MTNTRNIIADFNKAFEDSGMMDILTIDLMESSVDNVKELLNGQPNDVILLILVQAVSANRLDIVEYCNSIIKPNDYVNDVFDSHLEEFKQASLIIKKSLSSFKNDDGVIFNDMDRDNQQKVLVLFKNEVLKQKRNLDKEIKAQEREKNKIIMNWISHNPLVVIGPIKDRVHNEIYKHIQNPQLDDETFLKNLKAKQEIYKRFTRNYLDKVEDDEIDLDQIMVDRINAELNINTMNSLSIKYIQQISLDTLWTILN